MSLRSQFGSLRRKILSDFCQRVVPLAAHGPIITFCFDDFPRTALTIGADIVEAVGARATYYVAMSLMNTTTNLGEQFCDEDLFSAVERGHELASHTFSHLSARRVAHDAFRGDVDKGERAIQEGMRLSTSGNFAYPYGEVTLGVKRRLGLHFTSCRGTYGGVNGRNVDLNLLRANSLYGDLDRAEAAKRLVVENESRNGWLIFYSHDVTTKPSPYGCTPRLLAHICSFAAGRNARFMTVAQVMKELGQHNSLFSEISQASERSASKTPLTYSIR
jgi:peptidoglycan/xylan/chitin deacetylase (PgdA/CDA1 family)